MPTIDELASQVAALEQQMAAITTPPDKYYTSIYSGEEIDAAITKVRSGAMGVSSFNGRAGAVMPQAGDYNATQIPVSADAGAETVAAALNNKAPGIEGVTGPASGVGWYRIAEVTISASRAVSFLVSIGHVYGNGGPSSILASVTVTGYAYKITILDSSHYISYCIDNLRLMQLNDSTFALDIHYSITGSNDINSRFICGTAEPGDITPQAPTAVQNAPSGESLVALADWLNPPMQLGVEYRTTERYNGKPVYVMAVDGGAFPDNSTKTIEVQSPDASGQVKMLDCYGVLDNGTQIPGLLGLPTFSEANYLGIFTQNGNGKFVIAVGSGRTVGMNFTLFLKYWKE